MNRNINCTINCDRWNGSSHGDVPRGVLYGRYVQREQTTQGSFYHYCEGFKWSDIHRKYNTHSFGKALGVWTHIQVLLPSYIRRCHHFAQQTHTNWQRRGNVGAIGKCNQILKMLGQHSPHAMYVSCAVHSISWEYLQVVASLWNRQIKEADTCRQMLRCVSINVSFL